MLFMFDDILKVDNITQLIAGIVMVVGSIALLVLKILDVSSLKGMFDLESLAIAILFFGGIQIIVKRGLKKKSS